MVKESRNALKKNEVSSTNNRGNTPLHLAVRKGFTPTVKLLLEEPHINPNLQNNNGNTPLHLAAKKGFTPIVKLLLEEPHINPNLQNNNGNTPLHLAAIEGFAPIVKLLLEEPYIDFDIDLNIKNNNDNTPLYLAYIKKNYYISELLDSKGAIYGYQEDDRYIISAHKVVKENSLKTNYDDSSSEEESTTLKGIELNFNAIPKIDTISHSKVKLSFIAHELGIRLVKSTKINEKYEKLRKEYLYNDTIELKKIEKSILDTLTSSYPEEDQSFWLNDVSKTIKLIPKTQQESDIKKSLLNDLKPLDIQRKTLDKRFYHEIKEEPIVNLIALGRLMTRSIKRDYKNANDAQINENLESILGKSPISEFTRVVKFPSLLSDTQTDILEDQKLYDAIGTRVDRVKIKTQGNSSNYLNIALTIENIKKNLGLTDKNIVSLIRNTLKGNLEDCKTLIESKAEWNSCTAKNKTDFAEFISTLTYLLFGTEAARNPASLIIHQMTLDLISGDKLTFLSAFSHLENNKGVPSYKGHELTIEIVNNKVSKGLKHVSGGLMPMSQPGAVEGCRLIHDTFKTSRKYSYDKKPVSDTKPIHYFYKNMIKLEANIIDKWLSVQKIKVSSNEACFNVILENFGNWFGESYNISPIKLAPQVGGSASEISSGTSEKIEIIEQINKFCNERGINEKLHNGDSIQKKNTVKEEIEKLLSKEKQDIFLNFIKSEGDIESITSTDLSVLDEYIEAVNTISLFEDLS